MKKYISSTFEIGQIVMIEEEGSLTNLFIPGENRTSAKRQKENAVEEETPVLRKAKEELREYFSGKRTSFTVPLAPKGTTFQQLVWNALLEINYGETRTYRKISEKTGNPKACRAVGAANSRNPIWIMIPCHRVIGKDGGLTGYAGGLDKKSFLLDLERKNSGEK